MPVVARYASALRAMLRGSREYASPVIGSWTKKSIAIVERALKGST
jgi:hypothetical protein